MIVTNGRRSTLSVGHDSELTDLGFDNHFDLIRQLLQIADECLLVSPFLYSDFAPLVDDLSLNGLRVELISTCTPRGQDQLTKPYALRSFGQIFEKATGQWPTIGVDQALHSKVYVFWKQGRPLCGIVTSANLTQSGLIKNHETGVVLTNEEQLNEVAAIARSTLDYVSLSAYQVDRLCAAADAFANEVNDADDRDIGLDNMLNNYATPSAGNRSIKLREHARYYIKVSGVSDRPILPADRRPFDEPHAPLSFAKSPGRISLGDCLLEVAVGGKCFLSYYACASAVYERTAEERRGNADHDRWPFYMYGNNLSLHYGTVWFEDPIWYDDVVAEFKAAHPDVPVTVAGKDHFVGAMQMGNSYIAVTKTFGEFVRARIDAFRLRRAREE